MSYTHISNLERGIFDPKPETLKALKKALVRGERGCAAIIPYGHSVARRLRAADLNVGDELRGRGRRATVVAILGEGRIKVRIVGEYGVYHAVWTDTPRWDWVCVGALWREAR